MSTKKVLILHEDLGFAFWLARILDDEGWMALPAKSAGGARVLLRQVANIDVLIVDASSAANSAFADYLRDAQRELTVIAVVERPADSGVQADIVVRKPRFLDEISRLEWLDVIELSVRPDGAGCNQCQRLHQEIAGATQAYLEALRRLHGARIDRKWEMARVLQGAIHDARRARENARAAYRSHENAHRAVRLGGAA